MTHATCHEPDEHLTSPRLGKVDLLNRKWSTEFLEDGGADLHRVDSLSGTGLELPWLVWYPLGTQKRRDKQT